MIIISFAMLAAQYDMIEEYHRRARLEASDAASLALEALWKREHDSAHLTWRVQRFK